MIKNYTLLPIFPLPGNSQCAKAPAPPEVAHWDDPALDVMINFKQSKAITIGENETLNDALAEMKFCHINLLIVLNDEQHVVGVISSEDILGERPVKVTQDHRTPRADIRTSMVMTPYAEVAVFNLADLQHAKVGNLVVTMQALKQHHALVIETDAKTEITTVCGLYSLSHIGRQLGADVLSDFSSSQDI
jgi:CBS domain-containing protein